MATRADRDRLAGPAPALMRQGEVAPKAAWSGNPLGGVKAPKPILLPAPETLFGRRAARLDALANGHSMEAWLAFMANLARAQARSLDALRTLAPIDAETIQQAVGARLPPLAAAGHRRAALWRDALHALLTAFDHGRSPPEARAVAAALRERTANEIEAMADEVLNGRSQDAGASLYVVAALQAHFAAMAASLPIEALRLLPERGLCPCCGSTPVGGVVTASGDSPGVRYLHCSLCGTAWSHVRAVCITCGGSRSLSLKSIEGDAGVAKAETCGECRTYAKLFYAAKDPGVDPVADDLATLGLDLLVAEDGWARHAPNPLLRL
jgi:FdhE protein